MNVQKYLDDLKEIKSKITDVQYSYLSSLTEKDRIVLSLEAMLETDYNESLDWLFSTLMKPETKETVIQFDKNRPQPFVVEILDDKIVININEQKFRALLLETFLQQEISKGIDPWRILAAIKIMADLPIELGKIF